MKDRAIHAMRSFLEELHVDLTRAGMEKTPSRVTEMFSYLFAGARENPKAIWGDLFHAGLDGLTAVCNIPMYSVCEHHLLPFFGEVHIVYLPTEGMVAGFSKFHRLVDILARRPQLQERLTREIAEEVEHGTNAAGVLVVTEACQLCMMMRGEIAPDTKTVTTTALGRLKDDAALRREAWHLLEANRKEGRQQNGANQSRISMA